MFDLKSEISRTPPNDSVVRTYRAGTPILYAFGCVLLERDTGKTFVYTAVNLTNGKSIVLSRRTYPLTASGMDVLVDRIRRSHIAGAGQLQADRPVGEHISLAKAREIQNAIFAEILPRYGYTIRKEQIALADHILTEIARHDVTLAEAEVGTGKTLAYLIPAIIVKRGRLNDFWNMGLYPKMQYAEMSKMPIVVATSSIALQRAIMTEYIPEISQILLESGVINTPLTAVLRKGKEHYVCERNLRAHLPFEHNPVARRELERLLKPSESIDLAEADITPHVKRKISVSGRCFANCPYCETCKYTEFREQAASADIDIQVCNHNYLLADTLLRENGQNPLIPNYQTLIVDEAHKFLQAARTMYGSELSGAAATEILDAVDRLTFKRDGLQKEARRAAKKLFDESTRLFVYLIMNMNCDDTEDDSDRFGVELDREAAKHLRNIHDIAERLIFMLRDEVFYVKTEELLLWVSWKYRTNSARINIKKILSDTDKSGERENQRKLMRAQLINLHNAICELPEIERAIVKEHTHRNSLFSRKQPSVSDVIWQKVRSLLPVESVTSKESERLVRLIWSLEQIRDQSAEFANYSNLICWLETDESENRLCAIPKDLGKRLFDDQWSKGLSTILTSGTLSASGNFSHTKRTLGLDWLKNRLTTTSKPSPFNYRDNALLYISENVPLPDNKDKNYIAALTDEIERLIYAANGHTAVLFTSYNAMGLVYAALKKRNLPFPMFRLDKGGVREIERFKQSDGGVLFASGALWEGIDIKGDALSMLIIARLPFPVPDAIGEYEKTLYKNMSEYINCVVVPEMLIKLKQGFGRLIRTETDTGVVAILDCRAGLKGVYRLRVLRALPGCRITSEISEVAGFYKAKKKPDYFKIFRLIKGLFIK